MNMKYVQTILMLLAALGLSQSCIKDDRADCEHVSLYFRYLADTTKNVLGQYMDQVDLYVYDDQNNLVQSRTYRRDELKDNATPRFRLNLGSYHVVAIGNKHDRTRLLNHTGGTFDNMMMTHPLIARADGTVPGFDANYLGYKDITIPVDVAYTDTVDLHCSHIDVDVTIKNAVYEGSDGYSLVFDKAYSHTDFWNHVTEQTVKVVPMLDYNGISNEFKTVDLNLYRFGRNCPMEMSVVRNATGEVVAHETMSHFLARYPRLNFEREEIFLPIEIVFDHLGVTIQLPYWFVKDIDASWGTNARQQKPPVRETEAKP